MTLQHVHTGKVLDFILFQTLFISEKSQTFIEGPFLLGLHECVPMKPQHLRLLQTRPLVKMTLWDFGGEDSCSRIFAGNIHWKLEWLPSSLPNFLRPVSTLIKDKNLNSKMIQIFARCLKLCNLSVTWSCRKRTWIHTDVDHDSACTGSKPPMYLYPQIRRYTQPPPPPRPRSRCHVGVRTSPAQPAFDQPLFY